ncbi:MAG: hypothetical protein ACI91T_001222, partial [Natronomonas sp.]
MDSATLEAFVDHARSALDADPGMSTRTAELRITQPFLEALDWDVHGPEVEAGYRFEDEVIGFALGRGDDPSVFVETIAPSASIDRSEARRFAETMRAAGVELGVLLDGRRYCFVASVEGTLDVAGFSLDELPDHPDVVSYYDRDAVVERETTRQAKRRRAAERLAKRRDEIAADLADRLADVTGEELRSDAAVAAGEFVDEFAADLRGDRPDGDEERPASTARDQPGTNGGDGDAGGQRASEPSVGEEADAPSGRSPPDERGSRPGSRSARSVGDQEYIVRFFDGGTSIGAVKAASPSEVLVQSVAYLDEGRHLLGSLSIPWSPEEWNRSVIAHEPTHSDGSPMGAHERLSSGHCLRTDMDDS